MTYFPVRTITFTEGSERTFTLKSTDKDSTTSPQTVLTYPLVQDTDKNVMFSPQTRKYYFLRGSTLTEVDPRTEKQVVLRSPVTGAAMDPQGNLVFITPERVVYRMSPRSGSVERIMKSPIYATSFVGLDLPVMDEVIAEDDDDEEGTSDIGSDDEEDKPDEITPERKRLVYYLSGDSVVMVTPEGREAPKRIMGATFPVLSPNQATLYYVYNREVIMKQPIGPTGQITDEPTYVVKSPSPITSLSRTPQRGSLVYTTEEGEVISLNTVTKETSPLVRQRDMPKLAQMSPEGVLTWVEDGNKIYRQTPTSPSPVLITTSPTKITSIAPTPQRVFFVTDKQVKSVDPEDTSSPIRDHPTTRPVEGAILPTPAGILYPTGPRVVLLPARGGREVLVRRFEKPISRIIPTRAIMKEPERQQVVYYITSRGLVKQVEGREPEFISRRAASLYTPSTVDPDTVFYTVMNRAVIREDMPTEETETVLSGILGPLRY